MDRVGHGARVAALAAFFFACASSAAWAKSGKAEFAAFLDGSFAFPVGLALYPGAELSLYSFGIGENMTLTLGVGATGQVAFAKWADLWSYTTFGAALAPFGVLTFHESPEDALSFLERLEISVSPGIGLNYYLYSGDPSRYAGRETVDFGFAGILGCRLRISRFVLLRFDATFWGLYIGPNIALGLQLELW